MGKVKTLQNIYLYFKSMCVYFHTYGLSIVCSSHTTKFLVHIH